jgi:hypothetical protein
MTSSDTPTHRSDADATAMQTQAKALANNHREALNQRARRIRRRIASAGLALFTAAFVGIYVQMASGHDPALTAASHRGAVSTSLTSTKATSSNAKSSGDETEASSTGKSADTTTSSSGGSSTSDESESGASSSDESSSGESSTGASSTAASSVTTSQS